MAKLRRHTGTIVSSGFKSFLSVCMQTRSVAVPATEVSILPRQYKLLQDVQANLFCQSGSKLNQLIPFEYMLHIQA
jgi:hypothetical protein